MCGTKIVLTDESDIAQVVATLGGIVLAKSGNTMTLYGFTAGHAIARAYGQDYYDAINTDPEQDDDSCSDDDDDDGSALYEGHAPNCPEDQVIVSSSVDGQTKEVETKLSLFGIIDGPELPPKKTNYDWGLIPFLEGDTPGDNCIYIGSLLTACTPSSAKYISLESRETVPVAVITSRGNQPGTLTNNVSSLLSTIGKAFISVFDFTPDPKPKLIPGDSGTWVVHTQTGEVYGHVVSVDSFGEAYVMPIQWTLEEIRFHLGVDSVTLASKEDMESFRGQRREAPKVESPSRESGSPASSHFRGQRKEASKVESPSRESDIPASSHSTKDDPPILAYRSNSKLSEDPGWGTPRP